MIRKLVLTIASSLALLVAGYTWYRVLTFDAVTAPRTLAWYDAEGTRIDERVRDVGDAFLQHAIVIDDRVIVNTRGGFAQIAPAAGEARIVWPVDLDGATGELVGVAVRDVDMLALLLRSSRGDGEDTNVYFAVGIAGRGGWVRPPTKLVEWKRSAGAPLPHGMSWFGDELHIVLSHPTEGDEYGLKSPADVIVVRSSGPPSVTSRPLGCELCVLLGALPGATGWSLVVHDLEQPLLPQTLLVGADGTVTPARSPWPIHEFHLDRTALGVLPGLSSEGPRLDRRGAISQVQPPFAGWHPLMTHKRLVWSDGVLLRTRVWNSETDDGTEVLAQRVGDRTVVMSSVDDVVRIGRDADALRPAIAGVLTRYFATGAILPRSGGGYHWIDGEGRYVTLDDELRRIDPLPLREHLRERGIYIEPQHERRLAFALFGLPLLALVGVGVSLLLRERKTNGSRAALPYAPVVVALAAYIVFGARALWQVLPLL